MARRFGLGWAALVWLVVLAAPAAAAAAGGPPQFVIGPVKVGHGYEVFAASNGYCNTGGSAWERLARSM